MDWTCFGSTTRAMGAPHLFAPATPPTPAAHGGHTAVAPSPRAQGQGLGVPPGPCRCRYGDARRALSKGLEAEKARREAEAPAAAAAADAQCALGNTEAELLLALGKVLLKEDRRNARRALHVFEQALVCVGGAGPERVWGDGERCIGRGKPPGRPAYAQPLSS